MPQDDTTTDSTPEETPQGTSKRHWWQKPKVQDKPSRAEIKAYEALLKQGAK